jgi:lactoylglutathione lyase
MQLNLLVIKTHQLDEIKAQYELLGFDFIYHNHGKGPFHYSAELGDLVFEIYPLPKNRLIADDTTRLGFSIQDVKTKITELKNTNWKICSNVSETKWRTRAVIQDLDGRKIELITPKT